MPNGFKVGSLTQKWINEFEKKQIKSESSPSTDQKTAVVGNSIHKLDCGMTPEESFDTKTLPGKVLSSGRFKNTDPINS